MSWMRPTSLIGLRNEGGLNVKADVEEGAAEVVAEFDVEEEDAEEEEEEEEDADEAAPPPCRGVRAPSSEGGTHIQCACGTMTFNAPSAMMYLSSALPKRVGKTQADLASGWLPYPRTRGR
mmetsp:Transcript_96275/g.274261  ORF Transcript_96275/g.274261 Transcript_96275/m.274261 type:complete len:121 (-) Transcript_96275:73-435(-)